MVMRALQSLVRKRSLMFVEQSVPNGLGNVGQQVAYFKAYLSFGPINSIVKSLHLRKKRRRVNLFALRIIVKESRTFGPAFKDLKLFFTEPQPVTAFVKCLWHLLFEIFKRRIFDRRSSCFRCTHGPALHRWRLLRHHDRQCWL